MSDENPSFTTKRRGLRDVGDVTWGGDGGPWSDAIETSSGVTVTDDGTVTAGEGSVLFDSSDGYSIVEGSPSVDESNYTVSNLRVDGNGDDNRIRFEYSGALETFTIEYNITNFPPGESTKDRYWGLVSFRDESGYELHHTNVVGSQEVHVYDPVSTNQDYNDKRDKNYATGVSAYDLSTIEISWNGSAWVLDVNSGEYVRTMDGLNEPVDYVEFGSQGTSDPYLSGTMEYDIVETVQ